MGTRRPRTTTCSFRVRAGAKYGREGQVSRSGGRQSMRIARHYTVAGKSAYEGIAFRRSGSEIRNPDGSVVFSQQDIEVPATWSQVALDVAGAEIFPQGRRACGGQPAPRSRGRRARMAVAQGGRSIPRPRTGGETSTRQVFDRLAGTWTYWGWKGGYFDAEDDAQAFYDEMCLHAGPPDGRAQQPAMVQHRPALGLRHRRARPGPFLCRSRTGKLEQIHHRL